jgi:glycosyltransferase involved in cell wall biosynthesis
VPVSSALRLGVLATHPIQYYTPLYRELAARGVDLTVYFAHRPDAAEQGTGFGVAFQWDLDLLGGYDHRFLRNVAKRPSATEFGGCDVPELSHEIRRGKFDVFLILGWHSKAYWQAVAACRRAGVPVLVRGDSQLDPDAPLLKRTVKRVLYPLMLRAFAACLSVGVRSRQYFEHYGARRIVRSPHFVDNERFGSAAAAAAPSRDEHRRGWGAAPADLVLLFAGKLIPKKRPLDLVRAVARSGCANVLAVFVGDGELRSECAAEAARLGVRAHFAGFRNQSELPSDYGACDLLVLPSDARETWGLVVNEAMACGRGALVSRAVGCSPDMIHEGVTGHTFALGDVASLGEHVARLAGSRSLIDTLGMNAQRHVAGYSVASAADGVLEAARLVRRTP